MDPINTEEKNGLEDVDIGKSIDAPPGNLSSNFPELKEPTVPPKVKIGSGVILMMLVVSLICSTMSVTVYDRYFAQKIVTINLRQYMENQRELYLAGKVTADQVKQNLDGLIASVKNAPKNKVVLLEDVVANSTEKLESR